MPIESAILLSAFVVVFVVFGATLAWASHVSRNLPKN
jgi:hypothetical protein